MATKHGKVVTHQEGLPPINLHNLLNMCSREITQQIRNTFLLSLGYVHKTYHCRSILQEAPIHKIT